MKKIMTTTMLILSTTILSGCAVYPDNNNGYNGYSYNNYDYIPSGMIYIDQTYINPRPNIWINNPRDNPPNHNWNGRPPRDNNHNWNGKPPEGRPNNGSNNGINRPPEGRPNNNSNN